MNITDALAAVEREVHAAADIHEPMHSLHEGFAVILEEMDELRDEVWAWHGSAWRALSMNDKLTLDVGAIARLRKEAKQVAAMAIRFMVDLT